MVYSTTYEGDILKLVKDGDLEYYMYPIEPSSLNQSKPAFSIALPGQDARNNVLMGIEGMSNEITVDFYIWNDGNDRANSSETSHGSTVITLQDQMDYLLDTFHDPSFTAGWTLSQWQAYSVFQWPSNSYNVHIENIRPNPGESPRWVPVSMDLTVGDTV